ncbi:MULTISPECIES: serine hydrolase [unclassified Paraburkholderia]|uniref:serine hydrolase domain-containing protein n=1 Tax=unclassified Paraburkholderia TaxID=2615204 RepID=UPI002AB23177|nr:MULTISPECIES: serine hydrolase [unclassified Paraburkholderia]
MNHQRLLLFFVLLVLSLGGCALVRPDYAARVATGTTAHDICSETFISGQQPDTIFAETIASRPGLDLIAPLINYSVDRSQREVSASLAGAFTSRAVFRGTWGCTIVKDDDAASLALPQPLSPIPKVSLPIALGTSPKLSRALDDEFAEEPSEALRRTKAVVVLFKGRLIAERYAPGYGPDTPILGFSISKSVTSALVGVLVREGKLRIDAPVQLDNGSGRSVPLSDFMRMTSGLDIDETGSGFDPSNRIMYVHTRDMATAARRARAIAAPGQRWAYSSASVHLVARAVRDAVGGTAVDVQRFAHDELFMPLGMQHVTMEMDETGTPVGAHYMLASARDWGRFGDLYLNDGVAPNGQRILPEDWVRWSTTPTLATNYGAGWWINHHSLTSNGQADGMPLMPDAPADTFYALGNLGQYIIVVPSKQVVIVRLGDAQTPHFDIDGADRLVKEVISALPDASS